MRSLVTLCVLSLTVAGCATKTPAPPPDLYVQQEMAKSAKLIEQTVNTLLVLERGSTSPANEQAAVIASTVAAPQQTSQVIPVFKNVVLPPVWDTKVNFYWRNDGVGFLSNIAKTVGYSLLVSGSGKFLNYEIEASDIKIKDALKQFSEKMDAVVDIKIVVETKQIKVLFK